MGGNKKMKFLYGLMCAVLLVSMPVYSADISKEKKELIKEFFELTNSTDMGEMVSRFYVRDMTDILRSSRPDIDPRAFEILKEEVNTVIREELLQADVLLEMSYPIYDKYFSAEELEDLIRFLSHLRGESLQIPCQASPENPWRLVRSLVKK